MGGIAVARVVIKRERKRPAPGTLGDAGRDRPLQRWQPIVGAFQIRVGTEGYPRIWQRW